MCSGFIYADPGALTNSRVPWKVGNSLTNKAITAFSRSLPVLFVNHLGRHPGHLGPVINIQPQIVGTLPNVMVKWLAFLHRNPELKSRSRYKPFWLTYFIRGFLWALQADVGMVPQIRPLT
jgi:hypothetical protein